MRCSRGKSAYVAGNDGRLETKACRQLESDGSGDDGEREISSEE